MNRLIFEYDMREQLERERRERLQDTIQEHSKPYIQVQEAGPLISLPGSGRPSEQIP